MKALNTLIMLAIAAGVSGCISTSQPVSQANQLQIKVAQLERQVEAKDEDIESLRMRIRDLEADIEDIDDYPVQEPAIRRSANGYRTTSPSSSFKSGGSDTKKKDDYIRVSASAEDVQRALKNAGYYSGPIDGKIGSGSQKGIIQFQGDHDLTTDGIIGRLTWAELKKYLE